MAPIPPELATQLPTTVVLYRNRQKKEIDTWVRVSESSRRYHLSYMLLQHKEVECFAASRIREPGKPTYTMAAYLRTCTWSNHDRHSLYIEPAVRFSISCFC